MGYLKAWKHPGQKIAGRCVVRRLSWGLFLQESFLVFQPLRHRHPDDTPDDYVRSDYRPVCALDRGCCAADYGSDVQVRLFDTAVVAAGAGGEGTPVSSGQCAAYADGADRLWLRRDDIVVHLAPVAAARSGDGPVPEFCDLRDSLLSAAAWLSLIHI